MKITAGLFLVAILCSAAIAQNQFRISTSRVDGFYHFESCPFKPPYDQYGTFIFPSVKDARTAGFKPCPRCIGKLEESTTDSTDIIEPAPLQQRPQQAPARFNFGAMFERYERARMDYAVGFLYSTIIPGGGKFYTGYPEQGVLYIVVEGGLVLWAIQSNDPMERYPPLILLLIAKIVEYGSVYSDIHDYNAMLRHKIGFSASMEPRSTPLLAVSFTF